MAEQSPQPEQQPAVDPLLIANVSPSGYKVSANPDQKKIRLRLHLFSVGVVDVMFEAGPETAALIKDMEAANTRAKSNLTVARSMKGITGSGGNGRG